MTDWLVWPILEELAAPGAYRLHTLDYTTYMPKNHGYLYDDY